MMQAEKARKHIYAATIAEKCKHPGEKNIMHCDFSESQINRWGQKEQPAS